MIKQIGWGLFWFVATIVLMVGAAYLWVFIYSVAIHTGGDHAFYEQYAQTASPVVAVLVALPVFYLMARLLLRQLDDAAVVAWSVVAVNLAMEILALASLDETFSYVLPFALASSVLKILGTFLGLRGETAPAADGVR